jgi:hypothetical protein
MAQADTLAMQAASGHSARARSLRAFLRCGPIAALREQVAKAAPAEAVGFETALLDSHQEVRNAGELHQQDVNARAFLYTAFIFRARLFRKFLRLSG